MNDNFPHVNTPTLPGQSDDSEETVAENQRRVTPGGYRIADLNNDSDSPSMDEDVESVKEGGRSDNEVQSEPSPLPVETQLAIPPPLPIDAEPPAAEPFHQEMQLQQVVQTEPDFSNVPSLYPNGETGDQEGEDLKIDDTEAQLQALFSNGNIGENNDEEEIGEKEVAMEDVFGFNTGVVQHPQEEVQEEINVREPEAKVFSSMIQAFRQQIISTLCLIEQAPEEKNASVVFADVGPIRLKIKWNGKVKRELEIPSCYLDNPKRLFDEELLAPRQTGDFHERQQLSRLLATRQAESRSIRQQLDGIQRSIDSKSREHNDYLTKESEARLRTKEVIESYKAKKEKLERIQKCIRRRVEYRSDGGDSEDDWTYDEPVNRRRTAGTSGSRLRQRSGSSKVHRKRRMPQEQQPQAQRAPQSRQAPPRKKRRIMTKPSRCDSCKDGFQSGQYSLYSCKHELCGNCLSNLRTATESSRLFECPVNGCRSKFAEEHAYLIAEPQEEEEAFQCRKCGSEFDDAVYLEEHMREAHNESPSQYGDHYNDRQSSGPSVSFACGFEECQRQFTTSAELADHYAASHPNHQAEDEEMADLPPPTDFPVTDMPALSQGLSQQHIGGDGTLPPLPQESYPHPQDAFNAGGIPGLNFGPAGGYEVPADDGEVPTAIVTESAQNSSNEMIERMHLTYQAIHGDHN